MATVYAVASAKGGVGKTTTTAAVATLLADSGADVVAIDADLGMANLAESVGVTPGGITLHDVLAGAADPPDAVHAGPAGLRVVPGAADLEAYAAADPSGLREVVAAFDDADYVFVDAGAGLSHDSTLPLGLADETLLVSTAERSALGDTEKTRQLTERLGGSVAGVAITRLDPATAADDRPVDAVAETLDVPVLGRIPEDDAVLRAVEAAQPLPVFAPDAPATRAYRDLTRALTGAAIDGLGLVDGSDAETEKTDVETENEDKAAGGAYSGADAERTGKAEPLDEAGSGDADDSGDVTETSREDDSIPDAEASDESEKADESEEIGESEEVPDEADAQDDEDIIVADSEQAGLGEPGDEEDIIVAAESPVEDIEEAEATDAEKADTEKADTEKADTEATDAESDPEATAVDAVDGKTETVGEDHVDGDDLEAMIEEDLEPETFDDEGDSTAEPTAGDEPAGSESSVESPPDEEPKSDGESVSVSESEPEPVPEAESGPNEETEPDPDDELAGSVPFRDDDTGTMNTAFSEDDDDDDDDDDDENGGFFSRLFGR